MSSRLLELVFSIVILLTTGHVEWVSSAGVDSGTTRQQSCLFMKNSSLPHQIETRTPFHDSSMQVCYDAKTQHHQKSCCTHDDVVHYFKKAGVDFRTELLVQNSALKNLLEKKLSYYQDKFISLVDTAERKTSNLLKLVHSLSLDDRQPLLTNLFSSFKRYLSGENSIGIQRSLNAFFDEVFPHVFYRRDIPDHTFLRLTDHYRRCVVDMRRKLFPQPFGIVPHRLGSDLTYTFMIARMYLESLKLAIHALNVTNHLDVDRSCLTALTRMHFCPICDGFLSVKPCRGFCLNVFRGCMSKMMEFSSEWDALLSSLNALSLRLRGANGFENILDVFDSKISEALMHSLAMQHTYYPEITKKENCGSPKLINSTTPSSLSPVKNDVDKLDHTIDLYKEIKVFINTVMSYHGWHAKISDKICNNSANYDQSLKSGTCWNGKHISLYNDQIPDPYFISQAKYNPEVSVSKKNNQEISTLKETLNLFKQSVSKHLHSTEKQIQSDEGEASGDGYREDTYRQRSYKVSTDKSSDDEDEVSGSGSGDGGSGKGDDGEDQERTISGKEGPGKPLPTSDGYEFEIDNPRSTAETSRDNLSGSAMRRHTSCYSIYIIVPVIAWLTFTHHSYHCR